MTSAPTPSDPRLKRLLNALVGFNLLDGALTWGMVTAKWMEEANPIMDSLLQTGPLAFGAVKVLVTFASAYLLWKARRSHWHVTGIVTGLVVCFGLLVAAEIYMALTMIGCVP